MVYSGGQLQLVSASARQPQLTPHNDLYCSALRDAYTPQHGGRLTNQTRTGPLDDTLVQGAHQRRPSHSSV